MDKLLTLVGVDSADQLTEAQLKVRASRGYMRVLYTQSTPVSFRRVKRFNLRVGGSGRQFCALFVRRSLRVDG